MSGLKAVDPIGRHETLADMATARLRSALMAGNFKPGERFTLRAVASALNVSMTPAREALFNLVAEGVLELDANRTVHIPELTMERVAEIAEIRISLEGLAARHAARHIDAQALQRMQDYHRELVAQEIEGEIGAMIESNWRVHFEVYQAARMPTLLKMIESMWLKIGAYLTTIYPDHARAKDAMSHHERLISALRQRDEDGASEAICDDIRFSTQALTSVIRANTSG